MNHLPRERVVFLKDFSEVKDFLHEIGEFFIPRKNDVIVYFDRNNLGIYRAATRKYKTCIVIVNAVRKYGNGFYKLKLG
jgi:hypothetical protein